jgi:hypothetical protein
MGTKAAGQECDAEAASNTLPGVDRVWWLGGTRDRAPVWIELED